MNPRVQRLREAHMNLSHSKYRLEKELSILTDDKIKGEPLIVRRALALDLLLRVMPIYIQDEELIVGGPTMGLRANRIMFKDEFIDPQISGEARPFANYATEEEKKDAATYRLHEGDGWNHMVPGWEKPLTLGLAGIRKQALDKLEKIDIKKQKREADFLRAVLISIDAAVNFIRRYAVEAQRLANIEPDEKRKTELQKIVEILDWVTLNPPRTFYEALQLFYLVYTIEQVEINDWIESGRFDQYMYPFYKRDIEEGRITRETAKELLECLWIKYNTKTDVNQDDGCQFLIGGLTEDGKDATNELSYLILEVTKEMELPDPKVSIRIHKNTSNNFLMGAIKILAEGKTTPGLYNDDVIIQSMLKVGYPLSEARNWANDGCCEPIVPGRTLNWPVACNVYFLDCLLDALQDFEKYETFEEFMEAYKKSLKNAIDKDIERANKKDSWQHESGLGFAATPFTSAITDACIEKMKDLSYGGAVYNYTGVGGKGLANVADALAVIKKFVYEEKKIGRKELLETLESNFEGIKGERMRQLLVNQAPKFGNDDDYVDLIAKEVAEYFCNEVIKHRNPRGGIFIPGLFTFGDMVHAGKRLGATPDGRKAGEYIAPHFSPMIGRDRKGPTAVIKSVTKIDHTLLSDGMALDMKFHPTAIRGPQGLERLLSFVRTYFELGGMQLNGLNVVDAETLRDAQKHPERHRDLTVRVFGFSAYFVTLTTDFQEHIIRRSEHTF